MVAAARNRSAMIVFSPLRHSFLLVATASFIIVGKATLAPARSFAFSCYRTLSLVSSFSYSITGFFISTLL